MPTISVIVPVYKVEAFLHRCVDSILGQTFRDFELILVDDGSPDQCPEICDAYAQKDHRVHVIHQENGGLSAARNTGIDWAFSNSDSTWLTFVDSDDWIHPQMLERMRNAVIEHHVNISICSYVRTGGEEPEDTGDCGTFSRWKPEDFFLAHNGDAITAWGKLYSKSCFASIRYPVGKLHEDEFVTYRLLFAEEAIAASQLPMYRYFQNPCGIIGSAWTPRRLDVLEGLRGQADYFQANGFRGAYQFAAGYYCDLISIQKENIVHSTLCKEEKERYLQQMNHLLREARRDYRDVCPPKWKLVCMRRFPRAVAVAVSIKQKLKRCFTGE